MKVTLLVVQLAVSLLILIFAAAAFGGTSNVLGVAAVLCLLAIPVVAVLEVLGLFRAVFKWLGWV